MESWSISHTTSMESLLAEAVAQHKTASLESKQCDAYGSVPLSPPITRQRNGRKTPDSERKPGLRALPPKAKQTSPSRVFPIGVCRTSENKIALRCGKKKRAHQRKIMSAIASHLISASTLITLHDKKYFPTCPVAVIPDLIKCEHFLQKSLDTEKVNYTNSNGTVRLGTIENTEHSFMVNTPQLAAPCLFDLNIPIREGLSGVLSESAQRDASFPQIESDREMKVQKDVKNTENREKSAVGTPGIQKCFSNDGGQNAKNSGEIILNFPGVNLLISLGSQKHEENEFKDINVRVVMGSRDLKEEKPLTANIRDYGNPSESEKPECDTRSNETNRHQEEGMSDTYHNTTQATISQFFDMEMGNKLKANAGTATINCSHTALQQEELLDGKKIQEVKHIDKRPGLRKPQEWWDSEEKENRGTVGPLLEAFRVGIRLEPKDECAQLEMGPIQSGKRKMQRPKKEVQSPTTSTETVWETGPCPSTNPLQVEQVKQRTDKPPDRDKAASPGHPALMPENSPAAEGLIETAGHKTPFWGKPTQTPDGHITEDKENLKGDLRAVATGPFKVRKKSSGPRNGLGVKNKIIKVKKPAFSSRRSVTARDTLNHKRKVGDSFERLIKRTLRDGTLAPVRLNVHPPGSSIHSNKTSIKRTPPKTQVEKKEKNLDSLHKESKTVDTLDVQLCHGVKLVERVLPETVAHVKGDHRRDAHPVKERKMEKGWFQGASSTEAIRESVDSLRMDSSCVANTNTGTSMQAELRYSAELELGPPPSGELLTGDPLIQSRERNVPSRKNDTREISCGFTQKAFSCSLNYRMSVLTHSNKKRNPTRFTNKSALRLMHVKKVKPPASRTLSTTGNKKNLKLDLKTKLKRINHAKSVFLESQNTLCLVIDRRLQGGFCRAQLKQGELASKIGVDSVAESRTFYNREQKRQEKQEPFVQAAPQHDQHQWAAANQRNDTLPDEPDPSPISLSQEQPANRQGVKSQKDSLQSASEDSLQMAPIQAEGFRQTTRTENGGNFPVVPKNFSLEAGNSSSGELTDTADDDLESDEESEQELDLYPVGKEVESSRSLQVTFLQSSDSDTRSFASRRKEKKYALRRSKKQTTVSRKYRKMREIKTSDSQTVNFRYINKLNHVEMNDPQQRGSIASVCLETIHSKVYILFNKKRRKSKSRAGKQKIRRLGCMQQTREKSPDGGNAQSLASADLSSSSSMKSNEEKGEEEPERFLVTQKSLPLILDVHQEKDHDLVKSDTQLNQVGAIITQVQPQTPTEVTSYSTLCAIPVEFQLGNLEDSVLSERDRGLSGDRRHKGQAADGEKEAQGSPASHTNPKQSGGKNCDAAQMNSRHQEKKLAAETSSLTNVTLDINTSSKVDSEKGTPGEKTPCSIQWNLEKRKVPLDDIKENDLQDKEEKENDDDALLKPFSQYSRDFVLCPHQSRDPNSQKLREQREKNILFVVEQDIPQQSQPADLTRRECAVCISSPKGPTIQPEESRIDEVSTDRAKYDIPADGTHVHKRYSWDGLEREGLKNDLQATITESSNLLPPEVLRSKRKSKVSTGKALQGKMWSTGVTMKRRKAFASKTLTIPQCGHRNNLLPKTWKSLISELLIQSALLPDTLNIIISKNSTAEKNKRPLTQELAATMLGSLSFSTPTSKERENSETLDKGNEMINSSLTVSTPQSNTVSVMPPLLNTEGSETGSIPCDATRDEGPRRKCDYAISEQKTWAEKDFTSLEPSQEPSPVSSESKCEDGTLEFSGKKYISPKARQASRLLHIARHYTRVHRKNRHHMGKHQLKRDKCMEEALLYAVEDAESCPLKLPTDELSLDTAAGAAFSSRIPQRSNAKEKAELQASLSTTFLRPFDFFISVLSDCKSQVDTGKLSENEITLNRRCSATKKEKISVSKIIKIDGHFITNHKKFKVRAKMKAVWLSENTTGVIQNIIRFLLTNSNVENVFKTEIGSGVSKSAHTRPTHGASPAEGTAECDDSVAKVGSSFLKDAKVHVGQCGGEKQEVLTEPAPFYTKNLTASARVMKKPSLEEPKGILFREPLPQTRQTYEANSEINVKMETNSKQVSLKEALSYMEKPHNCPEVSESTGTTTKHGVRNTHQSSSKEKSSFYLTGTVTSIDRHLIASKECKRHVGSIRAPNLSMYKGIPSQMKSVESQSPPEYHAAVNIKKTQDSRTLEIKVDNGEVNTDTKSTYMCMPTQQVNMESSQHIWDMCEKSSEGNGLDKAQMKRKEEFAQPPFGADQKRQPGPVKSDVRSANTVHCQDMLRKAGIYLIDQEGNVKVGEEFTQEVVLPSNTHTLQVEKQRSEVKTDWKTKSKAFALPRKQKTLNVLGPTWSSDASDTTYPETTRQKDEAKIANVKIAVGAKQTKLKAEKTSVRLLLTVGAKQTKLRAEKTSVRLLLRRGDSGDKKDLGRGMPCQHRNAIGLRRNGQNLVLKANLSLGCFVSPVTKLTSVKLEEGKLGGRENILPRDIMETPSNQRRKSGSGCVDVPRKVEENMKDEHDDCAFKDIHRQFIQQFWVKSEETKEHHSCKFDNFQRKTNSELTSQKDETDNIGLATSRSRGGTKVSTGPQDTLQQGYPLKQGVILQTMKEFPRFGMTNKFIKKQDTKTSSPQMIGEIMENPLDTNESLLIPRLVVQQQNMFTDPLPGSIPSQVPCQPHTEEPKENMKKSDKLFKNSTPQLKKVSNAEYISDMDHVSRSIEKLLLLIKEQGKRRKRSRGGNHFETAEDIKATMMNPTPFPNNSPPRTQFINTMNSGVFGQRDGTEPSRGVATLWTQQRWCVQGTSLDYTQELTSKVICHNKRRAACMEGILCHKTIKMKLRKTTSRKFLSVTRYGAHSDRKERRHSIKTKKELPQGKTVADLLWKDFCASGYTVSQIKKLQEVKEGKGKSRRPLNGTNMLSMQPTDNNSTSSTIRKSVQYTTMKQKEHQVLLLDITPQNKDQLMPGQQVEKPRYINWSVHLEKEAYRVVFPETEDTNSSRLAAQRPRADTECEFSTAQRVEQGVRKDSIKHALSAPPRRGGPEQMNSSSSKEHDVFLVELDTFQKETCKLQELFKRESWPAGLENVPCPFREPFHLESAKVAKEVGTDHKINNISHLFGLRETDPELGSKAQAFLCTDLENLYQTGTVLRGHAKSGHRPRILLNSVPCHKRAPRHSKPSSSTTRKDSGASAIGAKMNLKGKGKAEPTASPLKLNRQKVEISKKIRAKQLTIFAQNKEQIMEFFLSCVLYKLQTENAQKEISAEAALESKIFNPALGKAASAGKILGGHSPSSEGVNLHAKGGAEHPEDACEPIPASGTHSLRGTHQITSPQVEKELKTVDSLDSHALNAEKEEHNDRTKEQNRYRLSFSLKSLEEHLSCSRYDSYVQPHLEPHTKEALLKVGNVSSKVKGPDLSSEAQESTGSECQPAWILPSVILEQTKEQDPELPLESGSKTINCPSLLPSKKLSAGVQRSKSVSNDSSCMPTVSEKELLLRACQKKQKVCLSKLFLHCFSLSLKFLHEKQKGNIEYRAMNDTIHPERKTLNSKKLVRPNDYTPSNNSELHCYKKEKMIWIKHGKDKPGSVVIKARDSIPLPHLNLNKETSDIRQEKHNSQGEKNDIKGADMQRIMVSNITFKTEELSLSYPFSGKKLTLLFDSIERQGKVREGSSKSDTKLKNSCISLPPLLHPNLNSRTKAKKHKSEQLKCCLPPLKPLLSLNDRKVPFSKAFSRDKLCKLTELKCAPQRKEYRNNIVHLKDRLSLMDIAQKGKTPPFKYLPQGKAKRWNNKEPTQEEGKNTVREDVRAKEIPKLINQSVKKLARSHALSIKELQRETQEGKLVDQINTVVALSISRLQLNTFSDTQIVDREVYSEINALEEHAAQEEKEGREKNGTVNNIVRAGDIYSKAKKSPTLPVQNLSDLQGKTREQGGEVKEDGSKPGVTLTQKSSKTSVATSPQPTLTVSARIKKDCTTVLTRSSVSLGYVQNPLVSEGGIHKQQIAGDTSISLQNEKQPTSEEKEEAGMQIAKIITTHTYQETMVQELKDKQVLDLTKSSSLLPDQSHPKLSEKLEFSDTKLRLRNLALQRSSTKEETVPREAIVGDTMKDVKKQHASPREQTYHKEIIDRQEVNVTLRLHKLLLSQKLYRTELHIHINVPKPKEQDLRKMRTSQPSPTNISLCKGVQVDEERLRSKLSSPDAEKIVDKEAVCGPVRKGKQYKKRIKITAGLPAGVHCKRTKVSPIPYLLNTKEIVLNMKFLEKKVHNGKSELAVVATRSFLSLPPHPSEYSQDKTQRGTARGTGPSYPQGNFQEAADAQEPATKESAAVESDCIVKTTEYNVREKSKSVTRVHQISEHPQVEMENESDPQDHQIYLTRLGTITKEKMLHMSFEEQKGQPEKCEKETSTKIGHWEKENELKDNLSNKTSPKFSVSPTKISLKEVLVTSDTLVCSKRSVAERKQETGSGSFMTSEKGRRSNASLSKMLTPAKMSQNKEEQNVNLEEQAMPQSKCGQMIKSKSSPPNGPVHSKNQRIPLQTDVDKKTSVSIHLQTQSRVHMSTTEFNATRRKEDSLSIVPEQEQCDRALPPKSHESPLQSEHLEETNTASNETLKQTKPDVDSNNSASQKEGALKAGGSRGVALEEDGSKMQQSCIVQRENKAREPTSSPTSLALPPATEEPEIETQVGTCRENGYPPQEKLKRELELSTAKQNIQGQKLLQTRMSSSLYVYIPDGPESQKSRFAETNLKRELKPKYLTMRIPKHPISKTLGIIGCGSSSRQRKLKYAFKKPKAMVPSSQRAAGITVSSLCLFMISPPHNEGTVELETNPRREKRACHSEFQKKLSDARDTKDVLTRVKELTGTIHDNLENNYRRDFPPVSCVKTMYVSNSSEVMTEAKGVKKQESVTSPETQSHILQKFSEKGRDKFLLHFETKALEIKTNNLPRTAAQSYAMASAQDKSKPLFTCIHSATKEQKRTNRVVVLFDEKSFCKIDCDLQCKYLRSVPRPSVPVVSKANVLPKHTYKLDVGSGSECKTAEDREESSSLLLDTDLLQHVPFQKKNPQESSFFTRKFQEPPHALAFSAALQGTKPNDTMIPSELKLQMTPEKNKQCHLCFQETRLYKHYIISGTQQNTANLASSHSSWISDDCTNDGPLNTETSSDLAECPASDLAESPASDLAEYPASDLAECPATDLAECPATDLAECPATDLAECPSSEESDSEECVFIGNNFYLIKGSQKFLFEVPKAISLADLHGVDGATLLKSVYRDDPNDHHTRTQRKHTSPVTQPYYQSGNSRKHRLNSKMQSPDGLCHGPSSIVEIESTTSSITFSKDKHQARTTWSRTSYSLASSATEPNTKLHLAKKYGKFHVYPQVKERRKAKSHLWRKFNIFQRSKYSPSHSGEKHTRRKSLYHYESEESNPSTHRMPEPTAHQQNIKFYPERRENQPFFYACVPADSVDVIPQTIRWLIPSKILQESNFHIPQVAKSSSHRARTAQSEASEPEATGGDPAARAGGPFFRRRLPASDSSDAEPRTLQAPAGSVQTPPLRRSPATRLRSASQRRR
ncbi:hypothetical protein ACRRTK_024934 [Alexandromys fortis]